jgi:hypothetical protein
MERVPGFELLSNEAFKRLPQEEKLAYLTRAIAALRSGVPLATPRPQAPEKEGPGS